jgi:3-phosphoshikimate 1-carboxyvinyltransferase
LRGLGELRSRKRRLAAVANGLRACGVEVEDGPDHLVVHGGSTGRAAEIAANLDHRIAGVPGQWAVAEKPVSVDDGSADRDQLSGFATLDERAGARIARKS